MEAPKGLWKRLYGHFVPSEANHYRPASLSRDFLIAIVAVTCVVEGFLLSSLFMQSNAGQFAASVLKSAVINLTNAERADAGLVALTSNPQLTLAAQAKAEDMAARGYFSHEGPDGKEPWQWVAEAGYDYAYAGENLAVRFYDSADVVEAWMESPSHRANVVKGVYRDIGIGIADGVYEGQQTTFVVQYFGTSRTSLGIAPAKTTKPVEAVVTVAASSTPSPAEESKVPVSADVALASVPETASVEGESTQIPTSVIKLFNSPRTMALSVLAAILTLLAGALVLAVVIRIHVQPTDLLLSGVSVAALVASLFLFNSYVLTGVTVPPSSTAAAIEAVAR